MTQTLEEILHKSSLRHKHLCPRQVLGARMALYACEILDLDLPRADKRLLVIAETDGCTVDGLVAATNCRVGSRTLRILDFGKVAATFTDTHTERSVRIVPRREARSTAYEYVPTAKNKWQAMLMGYQTMPTSEMFITQQIQLNMSISQITSQPGVKAICESCDEEVINGREVIRFGKTLCRSCAGDGYYSYKRCAQWYLTQKSDN